MRKLIKEKRGDFTSTVLKISAVFTDYDGTLAREDMPMELSRVPAKAEEALFNIATMVPVGIITTKDFNFVHPRTRFAKGWACIGGLDIVLADGKVVQEDVSEDLQSALNYVQRCNELCLAIELKRSSSGRLMGFSIHWRDRPYAPIEFIEKTLKALSGLDVCIIYNYSQPYLDVFGAKPDKGKALKILRELLGINGNIAFIGDSELDDPALREAELSICVAHGQSSRNLCSEYVVQQKELGDFLHALAANGMKFEPSLLERREELQHA